MTRIEAEVAVGTEGRWWRIEGDHVCLPGLKKTEFGIFLREERARGAGREEPGEEVLEYAKVRAKGLGVSENVLEEGVRRMKEMYPEVSVWLDDRGRRWRDEDYEAVGAFLDRWQGKDSTFSVGKGGVSRLEAILGMENFVSVEDLAQSLGMSDSTLRLLLNSFSEKTRERVFRYKGEAGEKKSRRVYPVTFLQRWWFEMEEARGKVNGRRIFRPGTWFRENLAAAEEILTVEMEKMERAFGEWMQKFCGIKEEKEERKRVELGIAVDLTHLEAGEFWLKEIGGAMDGDGSCIGNEELDQATREGAFCGNGNRLLLGNEVEMVLGWWVDCGLGLGAAMGLTDEDLGLAERVKDGVNRARDIFLRANTRLVKSQVRDFVGRRGTVIGVEDMYQVGCLGVLRAIDDYNWRMGKFSTYATPWIRAMIEREIANTGSTIRLPYYMQQRPEEGWSKEARAARRVVELDALEPYFADKMVGLAGSEGSDLWQERGDGGLIKKVEDILYKNGVDSEVVWTMKLVLGGWSVEEIARKMEVTGQTVKNRISRASGLLKDSVRGREEGSDTSI